MKISFHKIDKPLIRRITISKRIVLLVLLISILPIMIMGFFGYTVAKKAIHDVAASYNQTVVTTLKQNIDLRLEAYVNLADEIMLNSVVRDTLGSYDKMNSTQKQWATQEIYKEIRSKYTRIYNVHDIRIVTQRNIPVYSTGFLYLDSDQDQQNFQKIHEHTDSTLWYISEYDNNSYFLLSRKIFNLSTKEVLGYIMIHIDTAVLDGIYSDFELEENANIALLDHFGNNFSAIQPTDQSLETVYQKILKLDKSEAILPYKEDRDNFIYYSTMQDLSLTLVTSIPYSFLIASIQNIFVAIIIMMAVFIVLCLLISRYIWSSITTPLATMVTYVEDASNMNFATNLIDESNDELGFMTKAYNRIVTTMKHMVMQIETEQESKRKSEIKLLQAQINPHFLFNTLDSLRFTAMMSQAPTVSEGLSSLSHILRNTIIGDNPYITLTEEIKNIKDYIVIQKIRYGEFIELIEQVDDAVADCLIMKFLLQPIVENSIIHGMGEKDMIRIYIIATQQEDKVNIVIQDNGNGFDIEALVQKPKDELKGSKLSGVGLENVKQRLWLEFKEEQSFQIESCKQKGTTVTITFPVKE